MSTMAKARLNLVRQKKGGKGPMAIVVRLVLTKGQMEARRDLQRRNIGVLTGLLSRMRKKVIRGHG